MAVCAATPLRGATTDNSVPASQGIAGGQTTISPPLKVNFEDSDSIICLESGIDTLYLSIDVDWTQGNIFLYFAELKEKAIAEDSPVLGFLHTSNEDGDWPFLLQPYGRKGYEWILEAKEFTLSIGNWETPKSRPSMKVEIGSETLWHLGAEQAIQKVYDLIQKAGGYIATSKASRVDVCLDILCPESLWDSDLRHFAVTRAAYITPHFDNQELTGITIGKGKVSATLYDKPKEIDRKSKKFWMYDIWGLTEVPEQHKVIRIEFKLRREAIKTLGLNTPEDVLKQLPNLWSYCTQTWLKFQSHPGKHHTQRSTHQWWLDVQSGFKGAQGSYPLVRVVSIKAEVKQLTAQIYGLKSSLVALHQEFQHLPIGTYATLNDSQEILLENIDPEKKDFSKQVELKRANFSRTRQKAEAAKLLRYTQKFPIGK